MNPVLLNYLIGAIILAGFGWGLYDAIRHNDPLQYLAFCLLLLAGCAGSALLTSL